MSMNKMSRVGFLLRQGALKTSFGNTWEYELDWTDCSAAQILLPEETLSFNGCRLLNSFFQYASHSEVFWGNNATYSDSKHLI